MLPPIVLVHGLVVSSRMVEPFATVLGRHFRVIAPDLPGFGESMKPARALTVPELADALAAWLRTQSISSAILIGASFGCHIIVELAVRHPELVDRLVLQGPGPDPPARRLRVALWRQLVNGLREPRRLGPISRADYAKAGLRRAAATIRMALAEPIEKNLPRVQAPTLVVRGSRDVIVPQYWAEHVANLLPHGRLAVVEGGAHVLSYGAPHALAATILPFLREAKSGTTAD